MIHGFLRCFYPGVNQLILKIMAREHFNRRHNLCDSPFDRHWECSQLNWRDVNQRRCINCNELLWAMEQATHHLISHRSMCFNKCLDRIALQTTKHLFVLLHRESMLISVVSEGCVCHILAPIIAVTHDNAVPEWVGCPITLTHRGQVKKAAILQTIFSNAFPCMKMYEFRFRFYWLLSPRVQLTISQHWFRKWLGADQPTRHYLNQWWLVHWRKYASSGLNELTACLDAEPKPDGWLGTPRYNHSHKDWIFHQ